VKTSDGISEKDWNLIINLAEDVVELTGGDLDSRLAKKRLIRALARLELKYGRIPSILSTKADYVDDEKIKLSLLKEAYLGACELSDFKNRVFISSTITELYVEVSDQIRARYWIDRFKEDLNSYPDEYLKGLYFELLEKVNF
jgi:hypothetical protein